MSLSHFAINPLTNSSFAHMSREAGGTIFQYLHPSERGCVARVCSSFHQQIRDLNDLEAGENRAKDREIRKVASWMIDDGEMRGLARLMIDYKPSLFFKKYIKNFRDHDLLGELLQLACEKHFIKFCGSSDLSKYEYMLEDILPGLEFHRSNQFLLLKRVFFQGSFHTLHQIESYAKTWFDWKLQPKEQERLLQVKNYQRLSHSPLFAPDIVKLKYEQISSQIGQCWATEYLVCEMRGNSDGEKLAFFRAWLRMLQGRVVQVYGETGSSYLGVIEKIERLRASKGEASEILHLQRTALDWLIHALYAFKEESPERRAWIDVSKLISAIYHLRLPQMRSPLVEMMKDNAIDSYTRMGDALAGFEVDKYLYNKVLRLILSHQSFNHEGADAQTVITFAEKIGLLKHQKRNLFWDVHRFQILVRCLYSLQKIERVNRVALLKRLSDEIDFTKPKEFIESLRALQFLLDACPEALEKWFPLRDEEGMKPQFIGFSPLMESCLADIVREGDLKEGLSLRESYEQTFARNCRQHPHAVLTYYGKLKTLNGQENEEVLSSFLTYYFLPVLNGDFHSMRYDRSLHPHLQKLDEIDPHFVEKWQRGSDRVSLEEFLASDQESALSGYTVEITDNPIDLLLSGTEVEGSCESVYGYACHNKGLIGRLVHPQTLLIAVKDGEGKIAARAVFRALINEAGDQIMTYLEPVYPKRLKGEFPTAIIKMAEQKAAELGVPLRRSLNSLLPIPGQTLRALPGPGAFEGCDAMRHLIVARGEIRIG